MSGREKRGEVLNPWGVVFWIVVLIAATVYALSAVKDLNRMYAALESRVAALEAGK